MTMDDQTGLEQDPNEMDDSASADEIEQLIERIGARYIADLRVLSEEFGRFYDAQLAEKDVRIAELSRHVEVAEHERDALERRIYDLQRSGERYIADLRALGE